MNIITIMGRLVRDVELRTTASGAQVASFTVAVDRRFKDASGQRQTDFLSCIAWKETAAFTAKYFHKGSMIAVVGSVQTRTWEGQDGQKKYATEIVADQVHFTGEKQTQGAAQSDEPPAFDV